MQTVIQNPAHSPSLGALAQLAVQPVTQRLSAYGELPAALLDLLGRAAVRLLDSHMLITQTAQPYESPAQPQRAALALAAPTQALEKLLHAIKQQGLARHYRAFMQNFAHLFSLFLTRDQQTRARACIDQGSHLRFLMSDAGGPGLNSWHSVAHPEADGYRLHIDKVWGMYAHLDGMAIVAARVSGSFFPSAFLIWPQQYQTLTRTPCGEPFLGEVMQLGNVKGSVKVAHADRLTLGGPAVLNKYLTTVRPFLVRALMAHLHWLEQRGRLTLTPPLRAACDFIAAAAQAKTRCEGYDSQDVYRVLALKFASNELLLHLVSSGALTHFADQRDLLAFTKMEGSSYRCYHELRAGLRVSPSERPHA